MIRPYGKEDLAAITRIHAQSGLPPACCPNPANDLFVVKVVADEKGKVVQAGFVKITGEAYVLVDHEFGTPDQRLEIMESLVIRGLYNAAMKGFEDVSCWIPPLVEKSFAPRLKALGFERSPWQSYTAILK
jgi:hypothetical protein